MAYLNVPAITDAAVRDAVHKHLPAIRDAHFTTAATLARTEAEALPDGDPLIPGLLHAASLLLTASTGQEPPAPDEAEAGYVCGVCKDPECGHCLECTCEACDEARKYAETLASAETWVLSAAQTRVANLPTNFSGSHIAASRLEVLAAITRIDKEF